MKTVISIFYFILFALCLSFNTVSAQETENNLVSDSILLKEVVVKADKKLVTFKPDRYVIDATQIRSGKVNLYDLLRDVPGVIQEREGVRILGKSGVKVMINGRLKQVSGEQLNALLRSYQASEVVKVEIVYNPGAKYDAAGDYGILNFIMDKPKSYFVGGDVSNEFTVSDYCSNESNLTLKYNKKVFTSFLYVGYGTGKEFGRGTQDSYYPGLIRKSNTEMWDKKNQWSARYGMDFQLDTKSVCSLEASFSDNQGKSKTSDCLQTNYLDESASYGKNDIQLSQSIRELPVRYWDASFYIDRSWSKMATSSLIIDYYNRKYEQDYWFTSDLYDKGMNLIMADYYHFINRESRHLTGISCSLDNNIKLPNDYVLAVGAKTAFSQVKNESRYDYSNLETQNDLFDYREDCLAGYLTVSKSLGAHFNARLGGRYEYSFTEGVSAGRDKTINDYGHFFPDVLFSYRINDTHRLSLMVNGAVVRPMMYSLNPFRLYSNAYAASEGTPTLRPDYLTKFTLRYQGAWNKVSYSLEAVYTHENDVLANVSYMDGQLGTTLNKWANAYEQETWRAGYSIYYGGLRWMKLSMFGSFLYSKQKPFPEFTLPETDNRAFVNVMQLSFTFDRKQRFTGSLFGSLNTAMKTPFSEKPTSGFLRGGLNYVCLSDKLNLGLYVYNIISQLESGTDYSTNGMTIHYNNSTARKAVCVSIAYTFGKDIREKNKVHSSSDVKGRF